MSVFAGVSERVSQTQQALKFGWLLNINFVKGDQADFNVLTFFYRFSLVPGLHPDWMLMLFFVHTHLTVTVTLGLLLVPKVTLNNLQFIGLLVKNYSL